MARRRRTRKRKNPEPYVWALVGLGAVTLGAGGYAVYRVMSERKRRASLPPPPTRTPEGAVGPDACGAAYPGFVFDGQGCVPSGSTPAGVYVAEGCTDFVFVAGDVGPQIEYLEALIEGAATRSADPNAPSIDPSTLATAFFDEFWGECPWPPPATASDRISQLYSAFTYIIGREVASSGGRVLGTSDPETISEQIALRLAELGLPDFDPSVVPELEIPEIVVPGIGGGPSMAGGPDFEMLEGSQWYVYEHSDGTPFTIAVASTAAAKWAVGGNTHRWYVWKQDASPKTPDTAMAGSQTSSIEAGQAAAESYVDSLQTHGVSLAP